MIFNLKIISNLLGLLCALNGAFMLLVLPFSFFYAEDWTAILYASLTTMLIGAVVWFLTKDYEVKDLRKREGYLIVTMGWLVMSFSGTLPFIFTGAIPGFTNAFFETISGYTTTGATILIDIEALPKGVLFWRSL